MKNFLVGIQAVLNNREIAILFWSTLIGLVVLLSGLRKSFIPIFKILASKMYLFIFSIIGVYLCVIILLLKYLEVWQSSNLKDVIFWFFSVGLISVFKISDAKNNAYFKRIFLSTIKWTIILEFILNLYSFSLITEIVIQPFLLFLISIQTVADADEKHKIVSRFFKMVIAYVGFMLFSFSLHKTIVNFDSVLSFKNLVTILLPSVISILFIPFLYSLALYSAYESYFIHLDYITVKKDKVREVKKQIIKTANINLDKLLRIRKNFEEIVFYNDTDLKAYVQEISKKSYIKSE